MQYRPRGGRTGLRGSDADRERPGADTGVVQGGRLDKFLKPGMYSTAFWAVDKVVLAYSTLSTALLVGWWSEIPNAGFHVAWHVVAIALLIYQVKRPNRTTWVFRNWYVLFYVASCYKEMALYIPAVRRPAADQWLADLDYRFWGANPTVWLERI